MLRVWDHTCLNPLVPLPLVPFFVCGSVVTCSHLPQKSVSPFSTGRAFAQSNNFFHCNDVMMGKLDANVSVGKRKNLLEEAKRLIPEERLGMQLHISRY